MEPKEEGIEFEMNDKKHINIIYCKNGNRSCIGRIFTPSDSSKNIKNTIQVCGFVEAFELWGCGIFSTAKTDDMLLDELSDKEGELNAFGRTRGWRSTKDIQLLFDEKTTKNNQIKININKGCFRCYNDPCNCEIKNKTKRTNLLKIETKLTNPFTVKRAEDVEDVLLDKDEK